MKYILVIATLLSVGCQSDITDGKAKVGDSINYIHLRDLQTGHCVKLSVFAFGKDSSAKITLVPDSACERVIQYDQAR